MVRQRKEVKTGDEQVQGKRSRSETNGESKKAEQPQHASANTNTKSSPNLRQDLPSFILLVVLYLLQGVPLGLAFGSVPFLLKNKLSYAELGLFSLSTYPYSLKLAWSPIVDALYLKQVGRRKSWIVPTQIIVGLALLYLGSSIDAILELKELPVYWLSITFFLLVFVCATQDIAVDAWALTLLKPENIEYASTAQTIGLNTGYFLSFTVFLALNSAEFCNKYIYSSPSESPLLSLGSYLHFWGLAFLVVTAYLILFKHEPESSSKEDDVHGIMSTYQTILNVLRLPHMRQLILVLLIAKIGFVTHEAVTGLKLLELGFKREDLALAVLIDFPLQILGGYIAAKWSSGSKPLRPWLVAYPLRLLSAFLGMVMVYFYPKDGITTSYFFLVIALTSFNSFMSTIQFVGFGAFFARISDPSIGGTYMTLLNTLSNLGGTWPRYPIMYLIDLLTTSHCESPLSDEPCHSGPGKESCQNCVVERDGYFAINTIGIALGVFCLLTCINKYVRELQRVPKREWIVNKTKSKRS